MVTPTDLRFEHHRPATLGIGHSKPRISWRFQGEALNWTQASYQLQIQWKDDSTQEAEICSSSNTLVRWPWRSLCTGELAYVRVRVKSQQSQTYSEWSPKAAVEAGLLQAADWTGFLIQPTIHNSGPSTSRRPVAFSRELTIASDVSSARLYITSHGVYEARINGHVVGDHVMAPGWTSYNHRLTYQTFDVTTDLQGNNKVLLEVDVAEGWYCGRLGWGRGFQNIYGDTVGVLANLVICYSSGKQGIIATDESWTCAWSSTVASGIYDGEVYDARITSSNPMPVVQTDRPHNIVAPDGPPVRLIQHVPVQELLKTPTGKTVLDFGQNMVGRVRITADGPSGTQISLRHAEVLENGELGVRPLREAKATDTLILNGKGPIVWEPRFTFHGFRYVQVEGWPGELDISNFIGIVLHTDMERTGKFACSNPTLNKLHSNIVWSMKGNFLSIPTDCPQRDERLGWTGDIAMFADTANFLYDTTSMFTSWLKDLSYEQSQASGIVPLTVPNVVPGLEKEPHPIWGDVAILLPWSVFLTTGDEAVLARQYPSMEAWLQAIPRRANGLWNYASNWKLGDWLDPSAPPGDPGNTATDPDYVADAFLIHVTRLMLKISRILRKSEARLYDECLHQLSAAFAENYIARLGRLSPDSQTAYVLAVTFDLLNEQQGQRAAERLQELIRRNSRFCIATGFAGTPYVGHALTKLGLTGLFYRMLLHRKCPSWLYPVTMGATTIWERWDSMLPSGEINPGEMTSFNHYALGSVADWMHTTLLGLRCVSPGWSVVAVEPHPGGGIRWARGEKKTPCGIFRIAWRILASEEVGDDIFWLQVTVPPNTWAHVKLPDSDGVQKRSSGTYSWSVTYRSDPAWPPTAYYPPSFQNRDDDLPEDEELPYMDDDRSCYQKATP